MINSPHLLNFFQNCFAVFISWCIKRPGLLYGIRRHLLLANFIELLVILTVMLDDWLFIPSACIFFLPKESWIRQCIIDHNGNLPVGSALKLAFWWSYKKQTNKQKTGSFLFARLPEAQMCQLQDRGLKQLDLRMEENDLAR